MTVIPAPPVLQDTPSVVNWTAVPPLNFNSDNPEEPYCVFMNTATGQGACIPGQWYSVDLTQLPPPANIPSTATIAFIPGRLIITDPTANETGNITVAFRAPGSSINAACYQFQADSFSNSGGSTARTNMATWVPLKDGKFEFQWNCTTPAPRDGVNHTCYGLNLSLQLWG